MLEARDVNALHHAVESCRRALGSVVLARDARKLQVAAHGSAHVPLDWFSTERQKTRIQPAGRKLENRSFSQLSGLLLCHLDDEARPPGDPAARQPMKERVNFQLFFSRYLKMLGYIDPKDVPMGGMWEDMWATQRFEMHLDNVILFRNMLPFPVVLELGAVKSMFDKEGLSEEVVQEVLGSSEPPTLSATHTRTAFLASSAAASHWHSSERPVRETTNASLQSFAPSQPADSWVAWKSDVDGILELTTGASKGTILGAHE